MKTGSFCVALIGFSLEVVTGAVLHHHGDRSGDETLKNETFNKNDLLVQLLLPAAHSDTPYHVPPAPETSTVSTDEGVRVVRHEDESWKNIIIIACTVMASIEIVIVGYMIVYWKRIRWHLRKMNCPCCASSGNRRQSQEQQGIEMEERDSLRNNTTAAVQSDSDDIVEIPIVPRPANEAARHTRAPSQVVNRQQQQGRPQQRQGGRQNANNRVSGRGQRSRQSDRSDIVEAGPSGSPSDVGMHDRGNHSQPIEAQI